MKIALFDTMAALERSLRDQGHDVLALPLKGGVYHLPRLLARNNFTPDLVLQQEMLGPRGFFTGLAEIPCPTVFWAIDSHLNLFWQRWYGLLFDAVLTPHLSLFEALPAPLRPGRLGRFAWPGSARAFRPHAERGHALSFCARIDANRPVRAWMAELLAPLGLHTVDGLSWNGMMALYDDSRAVPNESIANEVNFRLMEAASSGCLALTPDVGEDQNALLEPGAECLVYRDGLELLEYAAWAKARPRETERLGAAARRRILAEHLPEHRARSLTALGATLSGNRLTGAGAEAAYWLTLAAQTRDGRAAVDPMALAGQGHGMAGRLADSPDPLERELGLQVLTQTLLLMAEGEKGPRAGNDAVRALLAEIVQKAEQRPDQNPLASLEAASACSAAALGQRNFALAGACYLAWRRAGHRAGRGHATGPDSPATRTPRTAVELCTAWANAFARQGTLFWSGFRFVPEKGMLPESALAWVLFARHLEPEATLPGLTADLLAGVPAFAHLRLGFLAEHNLAHPADWRAAQDYGLTSIGVCRVETGLAELGDALALARKAGQERAFWARLKAKSPVPRSWQERLS